MPPASAQLTLDPGTVLQGTYEIVRRVGTGGMADVYEARHLRLPGRFAIKVLSRSVGTGSPEFLRFRREAEIASSLRHPHIVQVVDFNQSDSGTPYIVMEFLDGLDLAAELERRRRLPPARVATIVDQVSSALAAAHGRGVVHRDLKPQNIFLVSFGAPDRDFAKVLDFGISKVWAAATLTEERALLGTPQYMSPEQAESRTEDIDGRTDQFALAAIAYEMLAGGAAFASDNVPSTLYRITHVAPEPLARAAPEVARGVDAVITKALAKRKEDRYPSVVDFAAAFSAAIGGTDPTSAVDAVHGEAPTATGAAMSASAPTLGPAGQPVRAEPGASAQTILPAGQPARAEPSARPHSGKRALVIGGVAAMAAVVVGVARLSSPGPPAPAFRPTATSPASGAPPPAEDRIARPAVTLTSQHPDAAAAVSSPAPPSRPAASRAARALRPPGRADAGAVQAAAGAKRDASHGSFIENLKEGSFVDKL